MAEAQQPQTLSLSEQYALPDKDEKVVADTKPVEVKEVESPTTPDPEEVVVEKFSEEAPPAAADAANESTEVVPAAGEENSVTAPPAVGEESTEADPPAAENSAVDVTEESSENTEDSSGEEAVEEAPEIKLETAPADFRFPTTNQTRHCFTRYVEYHRCVAAKGEDAPECNKFQKYYRALCPGEWVDRWNEQRENGTFPGPL